VLERALADAEERLHQLTGAVETTARRSATVTGAEKDSKRLAELVEAKTRDLRESLRKLERDAKAIEHAMMERGRQIKADATDRSYTLKGLRVDVGRIRQYFSNARRLRNEQRPLAPK
jgi:chemotaxis regulatin CheY-phosphate phosphatase CheZ